MPTTSDHESSPLGFDPVEVAASHFESADSGPIDPDDHDTLITPRPEAAWSDDVLPAGAGGRRARREAAEEERRVARPTPSPLGRAVLPVVLVVVALVALVIAWNHLQDKDAAAAVSGGPALPSGVAVASPGADVGTPSTAPSVTPSSVTSNGTGPVAPNASSDASTSATRAPSTSPSASVSPSAKPSSSAPAVAENRPIDRKVPVVVLNATKTPGLASKVAQQLRAKGWNVVSVGNWTAGGIDRTTIYLNGHLDAQATIRKDFPAAKGAILMPLDSMPKKRMIIVVGNDYPGA